MQPRAWVEPLTLYYAKCPHCHKQDGPWTTLPDDGEIRTCDHCTRQYVAMVAHQGDTRTTGGPVG